MKISLIIPVYNVEQYLEKCLDSALSQTWKECEIIIVDDGSTDRSASICQEYHCRDSRIRLIRQENRGLFEAWVRGFREATGEYTAFLDGDDWVEPDYLERMAEEAGGADVVCCALVREYPNGQVLQREEIPPGSYERQELQKQVFPRLLNDGNYLGRGITPHRWGKLFRRELIEANLNQCDLNLVFGEDLNIFFPVMLDCRKLKVLDDLRGLYHYRQNQGSILRSYKTDMFAQIRRLYRILWRINKEKSSCDFTDQIVRDAFCLFLEYVKNEAGRIGKERDSAEKILQNYEKMKSDFTGVVREPIRMKASDRILEFYLERRSVPGVEMWLYSYFAAKYLTGGIDWKYRRKDKNRTPLKIVMTGPDLSVCGGIRTVAGQCLMWNRWDKAQIRYIPVYIEKDIFSKVCFFLKGFIRIWAICLTGNADIVHLHVAEKGSFYRKAIIVLVCRHPGMKIILHHHGAEFLKFYDCSSGIQRAWISWTLRHVNVNLVLGNSLETQMKKRFPDACFRVLYNTVKAVPVNPYYADAEGILFVGRLGKRKGVYDLLQAVAACESRLSQGIKIYLCGDGETEKVKEAAACLGIADRIVHIGWVPSEKMESMYRKAMMFVLPSYHEGMPMALLEAMAHGIPCIAGNVDAVPEVLEDGGGILIEPGDVSSLKRAILLLAENPEHRHIMGDCGYRKIIEKFDAEKGMRELERIWTEVKRKGSG